MGGGSNKTEAHAKHGFYFLVSLPNKFGIDSKNKSPFDFVKEASVLFEVPSGFEPL